MITLTPQTPYPDLDYYAAHELGHVLHYTRHVDWKAWSQSRGVSNRWPEMAEVMAEDFRWLFAPDTRRYKHAHRDFYGLPDQKVRQFLLQLGESAVTFTCAADQINMPW